MNEYFDATIRWIAANKVVVKWSAIALLASFITMGLPGALFYLPASSFFWALGIEANTTDKVHGDNTWPMLILASFLASLLIVPAHLLVKKHFASLTGWKHTLSVITIVWITVVLVSILMIYNYSQQS